ncbi:MAG TPA: four helix bundle protein [Ignavibacteriaceae bacterium]|nr:four helix bundle protein [Ignavibacteriaceae bacterium]
MKTHKDLKVWSKSIEIVTSVYKLTKNFPREELYGITSQIRRSAVSIPSNIAEGAARSSVKGFKNFLSIALGSASELETQIIISNNLNYIKPEDKDIILSELTEIRKMIHGLQKSLKTNS